VGNRSAANGQRAQKARQKNESALSILAIESNVLVWRLEHHCLSSSLEPVETVGINFRWQFTWTKLVSAAQ
jgi:hypothetical protein